MPHKSINEINLVFPKLDSYKQELGLILPPKLNILGHNHRPKRGGGLRCIDLRSEPLCVCSGDSEVCVSNRRVTVTLPLYSSSSASAPAHAVTRCPVLEGGLPT